MRLTRILHPTDFSDGAGVALRQAVRLAVAHRASLHVLHAVVLYAEDPVGTESRMEEYVAAAQREAREVGARAGTVNGARLDIDVRFERSVLVFDAIMRTIETLQPDLVVMGTHGRSGLSKFLIGSDAEKVLRHAPCHVMTLRGDARLGAPGGFRQALVAVDFSDHARRALQAARELVSADGVVTLAHVVEPIPMAYYAGGITSRFQIDPDLAGRVRDRVREWAGDPTIPLEVIEGSPADEIVKQADRIGADLVAVGTRGLTGLDHVLVGSVAERVCRFARAPVLVTK